MTETAVSAEDQRRIRFNSLGGIDRGDLSLAREVWLDELMRAPWATREVMKLGAHFMRYMGAADSTPVSLREMETAYQLSREDITRSLNLMRMMSAVQSFTIERDDIRATLNLTLLQRVRVLEVRQWLKHHSQA